MNHTIFHIGLDVSGQRSSSQSGGGINTFIRLT